jgi:hypothetical protein
MRKIFPGILLEKSAKMTRRLLLLQLHSGQTLLHLPYFYVRSLLSDWTSYRRNTLQFDFAVKMLRYNINVCFLDPLQKKLTLPLLTLTTGIMVHFI